MTAIEVFQFPDTGNDVRTVSVDGEPWFVVKDVCQALGISNHRDAISKLDEDEVGTADVIDSMGRTQKANVVNEAGIYGLIFVSRKAEAKAFKRWVKHDVLPSIRKTGRYVAESPVMSIAPPRMSTLELGQLLAVLAPVGGPEWSKSKAETLWAEATGAAPQIPDADRLLYVDAYLAERGVASAQVKGVRTSFGRRLAAAYRAVNGGQKPPQVTRDIDNRMTDVCQYSEKDRPLFDEVWTQHFAAKLAVTR